MQKYSTPHVNHRTSTSTAVEYTSNPHFQFDLHKYRVKIALSNKIFEIRFIAEFL
jgi:hypothetical protein